MATASTIAIAPKVVEMLPAGQLSLDFVGLAGHSLSEADRKVAEDRFRAIEPLIKRDNFKGLWFQFGCRAGAVIDHLAEQHGVKRRTLYQWAQRWQREGIVGLADQPRADKGRARVLNKAALDFLLAAAMPRKGSYGELSVREIFRAYNEERAWRARHAGKPLGEFEERKYFRYLDRSGRLTESAQLPLASYETFRVWFNRIPEVVRVMSREGEEAFHNTQEILSSRDLAGLRPLDYVVMDHRRLDIFCLLHDRGGWKLGRPWLTAAIDMRTRRWLSWVVVENPSSESIAAVLKRSILGHGVPSACYWDNGVDFLCEWFEGKRELRTRRAAKITTLDTAWSGVLETLGIRVTHAIVRRARSKIIEPNFVRVADFDRTLPFYCGHKPTARPERFKSLLEQHERWTAGDPVDPAFPTIEEVSAIYDEALDTLNERELQGEGMRKVTATGYGWMCPNEASERFIGKVEIRRVPPDVIQFAFAKRRTITIRNGEVRTQFNKQTFHFRLADGVSLMAFNGREVEFAYDPLDLETIALYHDSRFLGLAHCVELRRMGEAAFVEDEKIRRTARREVKRFINAAHASIPVPDYQERAARRRAVIPQRTDPARTAVACKVPAAIVEAAQADAAEKAFSFAAASDADIAKVETPVRGDDDGTFRFFQDGV